MNLLKKLSDGEILAENNGTNQQLNDVMKHCLQIGAKLAGSAKYYGKDNPSKSGWECWNEKDKDKPNIPIVPITELWDELQCFKIENGLKSVVDTINKNEPPEIWWIRVTPENEEVLQNWFGNSAARCGIPIIGLYRRSDGNIYKGSISIEGLKFRNEFDFGNEIDLPTFLEITGTKIHEVKNPEFEGIKEVEKIEPITTLDEKLSKLLPLTSERIILINKLNEIESQLNEFLK